MPRIKVAHELLVPFSNKVVELHFSLILYSNPWSTTLRRATSIHDQHSQQTRHSGKVPQHSKGHICQASTNIMVNTEKLKAFPRRPGK